MADNEKRWYSLGVDDVARELGVEPVKGLSAAEAQKRLPQVPKSLAQLCWSRGSGGRDGCHSCGGRYHLWRK